VHYPTIQLRAQCFCTIPARLLVGVNETIRKTATARLDSRANTCSTHFRRRIAVRPQEPGRSTMADRRISQLLEQPLPDGQRGARFQTECAWKQGLCGAGDSDNPRNGRQARASTGIALAVTRKRDGPIVPCWRSTNLPRPPMQDFAMRRSGLQPPGALIRLVDQAYLSHVVLCASQPQSLRRPAARRPREQRCG